MIGLYITLLMLLSYFLGSIPSGLIIGKVFKNIDIREHGSKNTGATNATRVLGVKYGLFAFLFDGLKGALVILIVLWIGNPDLVHIGDYSMNILSLYGMVAVLGHVFPIYINFKGGKAVATSAGMILAIEPLLGVGILVLFITIFLITRFVSLASMTAAGTTLLYFIVRVIFFETPNFSTRLLELCVILILATIIFARHKANRI
ncbi:MAG: glycerol-3-phosphate 1-O-acyltransferase PlsY, partial [Acholeplasmataceae bacterium]|nr:glycerol-3-phosphate 1-O-acyltransferase PlsY [Acholeplasmataceae bacterium]